MRVLLVFESMFGSTGAVTRAVADGLRDGGAEVRTVRVGDAGDHALDDVDLLVLAGPTHAFSISRPRTRSDAVHRGSGTTTAGDGVREWLEAARRTTCPGGWPAVAVLDTRAESTRHWPGAAARAMGRSLRHTGFEVGEHASFYVVSVEGPLIEGEVELARGWGRRLAATAVRGRAVVSLRRSDGVAPW